MVIPSVTGGGHLEECLASLEVQPGRDSVEVIVVDRCGPDLERRVAARFPWVRVLARARDTSIPLLRRDGIAAARAPLVAVTEDHVVAPAGWYAAILRAAGGPAAAVGGPLVNGCTDRVVDWAAFFCEYSAYVPPMPRRATSNIPGNNVVYTRSALERCQDLLDRGAWDSTLHARLRELGQTLWIEPEMTLVHKKSFGFFEFVKHRFHFARSFAGLRVPRRARWRRAAFMVGAALLPLVLVVRIGRAVAGRRYHVGAFVASLPLLILFLCSWTIGELCGYAFGEGTSSRKVQ